MLLMLQLLLQCYKFCELQLQSHQKKVEKLSLKNIYKWIMAVSETAALICKPVLALMKRIMYQS